MNWSGRYLRDLGVLRNTDDTSEIGWKSSENKQLGYFHEVAGAGKSKRKHKIMGLLERERKELLSELEKEFVNRLNNYLSIYNK